MGRWFARQVDGLVFRIDDPDHITRVLSEGWQEVSSPHSSNTGSPNQDVDGAATPLPSTPTPPPTESPTPAQIQARNDAARAAFSGNAPHGSASGKKAKAIKPAGIRRVEGEEA